MLRVTQSVWLPDPGGWMTGWVSLGKTAVTAFAVSSRGWRVTDGLWRRNYRHMFTLSVIPTSQALLSCLCIHCLMQSHHCGAGLVSLYCIWLRLFVSFFVHTEL